MRDGASGRSRGFGFLTFRDPKTVNVVMVKEHYLDGKIVRPDISTSKKAPSRLMRPPGNPAEIVDVCSPLPKIDPKRAIPRDEQERTSKIFVGGVSQEANEQIFKSYFAQFGRVVDATLMMDKDTGRPRGFGFVTFDSEAAVDATLAGDLQILGKPIEVKKAQPRGNMREEENESLGRGGPGGGRGGRRGGGRDNDRGYDGNNQQNQNNQNQQGGQGMMGGMTPQMMAQYWQKMQQYFATMQQQMASAAVMQNGGMGGMAGMNPQMMQQMQAMQQMKQMQAMQQQQMARQGNQSPLPQSPGAQGMAGMNPAMLQQMQQMQQMQAAGTNGYGGGGGPMGTSPNPAAMAAGFQGGPGVPPPRRSTPGYTAQEQMAFEQQKYEQQTARRAAMEAQQMGGYQPTSWEGMYDDVPQPPGGGGGRGGRGGARAGGGSGGSHTPQPQAAPPANAPTGPKNAGKPGANYRGGGRGGGHRGGFHPYAR
jgi:RNA-binding protein Musashi